MKKIAILVGVSEYSNANDLPACQNDTLLMKDLLESTNEYDDILCIYQNEPSSKTKQQIVSYLKRFENEKISQLLFYYTGHGDFDGTEFYYLLGDYDQSKHKQTSIENSELDNWIRLLKPALTVKVVDACHAGIQYIKDPGAFEKYLTATPKSFSSCYFMFSSQRDEYSYQNNQLSFFTKSLVESVTDFSGTEIRFKDIIDYISDRFESVPNQTPFFVTQATNTEIFARIDHKIRDVIGSSLHQYLSSSTTKPQKTAAAKELSLVELIKEDAKKYCTEEEVAKRVEIIEDKLSNLQIKGEISRLYDFLSDPITDLHSEIPKLEQIGKWISENENDYFAEPTYKTEEYEEEIQVPKKRTTAGLLASLAWLGEREYESKLVTRTRRIVNGYKTTYDTEHPAFRITAKPKHENLNWYDIHIAYILSKTEIRFFYLMSKLKEINWQDRKRIPTEKWRMQTCELKDEKLLKENIKSILDSYKDEILTPLYKKFLPPPEEEKIDSENEEGKSQQIN